MALLLERLGPGFPPDAQKHAAEILVCPGLAHAGHLADATAGGFG